MGSSLEALQGLYAACQSTPPCLLPNRIREALIRCCRAFGNDPPHSEDDSTPEVLLLDASEKILGLLENLGHFDSDGMESLPEWSESEKLAASIQEALRPRGAKT
jgi:hypothetical protein